MRQTLSSFALVMLAMVSGSLNAQTLQKIDNAGLALDGYFYAAKQGDAPKAPAILALHGCGGMLTPQATPNARTVGYAKLLSDEGWHVLFLDSFTPRGVKSVCGGKATVTQAQRVTDVQAAVAYLSSRGDVDASRLAILGWSHGGSTTLLANDKRVSYTTAPVAAVAFYPGCGEGLGAVLWQPARPVLMQLGADDDWTSATFCQRLAAKWSSEVKHTTYADAHHGFDSDAPVRPVVLSTSRGAKTVHAGGNPAAKSASQAALIAFLKEHFK